MPEKTQDVLNRIDAEKERYLDELKDFLRIPSVSTDPAYDEDVSRCADFVAERMAEAGLDTRRIETDGHPLVYGEWTGAEGQPTILFYGHYDVQPPDPLDLWTNPPFEPTVDGDLLLARGATDDKGQSYTHVKAVGAMLAERGSLPVNVKFLFEGEEESGGEAIEKYVSEDGGATLGCDAVVISDSSMYAPGQPSIVSGLRGMAYLELKVTGPNRDLHSGSFGGAVANPANALASILASLLDPATGRVAIPGFYDAVLDVSGEEREEAEALPFDEEDYKRDLELPAVAGEEGYTTRERTSIRPTCDVNGIFGGYQGAGAKTVLPSWAGAKVSMRLVPKQDPETIARLFTEHVRSVAPEGVTVEVTDLHGGPPVLVDTDGPVVEAAMAALEETWGKRPVRVREGGSIPIVSTFSSVLEVPVVLMGFGLSDDNLHSPNEKFNISHFYNGIRTVARMLDLAGANGEGAG